MLPFKLFVTCKALKWRLMRMVAMESLVEGEKISSFHFDLREWARERWSTYLRFLYHERGISCDCSSIKRMLLLWLLA